MPEERRLVTVLFADVVGSTTLGDSTDPEDVRAILGHYYAIARDVVVEHGGTVEKFIGDAVMAVFGLPQAHGDDADRAIAAAVALRDRVGRDETTADLRLRVGVNTGEVVASRDGGAADFLVTGDAVNVAARLQQSAEPGTILVGERTRRAVAGAFRFGPERRLDLRGKAEPIGASTVEERLAERRAPRAPLVGRESDLAQLALVARRAFTERRPQLVTVTAPAGTGKSRLIQEFVARLDGDEPLTVATAQCLPYGSAVTYLPLRGLVRGLVRGGNEENVLPRVRAAFAEGGQGEADVERLTALIGATLGETEPEERDREQLFGAWRLLVESLARTGRLVIVFEDLHWASDTLLDLVEHVTLPRTAAPLVMVALARPELIDRRPRWGGGRRNFTAIGLEPLSADETRRLVDLLTEGVPDAIAQRIVQRAEGNPFFVGELVRAYEDRRRAGARDADIVLPDTIHATVLARLDALPETERGVLQYAAVAGRTARAGALSALLSDRASSTIEAALESLVERELLQPQGSGAYTFRHIVIREVAYATLPRAERVRAHVKMAHWLETLPSAQGDELAELIAYHYRQAIALSPAEKVPEGVSPATVAAALERATEVAWRGGAYREAVAHIQEAIRLTSTEEQRRLYELMGDVLRFGDGAVDGYREAYERWRSLADGDPAEGARLLVKRLVVLARWSGSLTIPPNESEFAELVTETHALLERSPNAALAGRLACARAFTVLRYQRLSQEQIVHLIRDVERARRLFAEGGEHNLESEALDALGSLQGYGLGDHGAAFAVAQERLVNVERLELMERIDAWSVAAWELVMIGRYAEAVRAFDDARRQLRAGQSETFLVHVASWSAYAAALCGEWTTTLRLVDALLAMREESGAVVARFTALGWVAGMRVAAAMLDETRLARYRTTFLAIMDTAALRPDDPPRLFVSALLDGDAEAAHQFLAAHSTEERKAEVIAALVFDHDAPVSEGSLEALERSPTPLPDLLSLRIQLARALNSGTDALRQAVEALAAGGLIADAARAATLLALRTRSAQDRADAESRLVALGDRLYLQRLAES